jgi:predicted methyltransferase
MRRLLLGSFFLGLNVACGGNAAQPAPPPAPTEAPVVQEPAPLAAEPAPAPGPTAEEKKAAEEQKKLEADRAQLMSDHQAEVARLTPEILAEGKALAGKSYPSGRAALKAVLAGKHRAPKSAPRDAARHPLETLELYGFAPTQTVLEYAPGEGWYTELLAPALATRGKLLVTSADPAGPKTERATLFAERTKLFLERAPDIYGKVQPVIVDSKAPDLKLDGTVDLVVLNRGLHGMVNAGTLSQWLAEVHQALKTKGVLGVEQHRAPADVNPSESAKHGYLPEKWVIEQIEAAGFKLAAKSEVNANPKDTKNYADGVWALPPTLRGGDVEREKYLAIGESDRMTLKFIKVDPPKVAAQEGLPVQKAGAREGSVDGGITSRK